MRKQLVLLTTLIGFSFITTGCEVSKEEVMAKKFVLIAHNVGSMACSFVTMGAIADEFGLIGVNYHEDSNPDATCADYNKTKKDTCDTTDLAPNDTGYGSSSCAIGADSLAGGQDENKTKEKEYILVVKNIDPDLCGKAVIEPIAEDRGYHDVKFYGGDGLDCSDFPGATCESEIREKGEDGYGNSTCVVGTNTKPTP